MNNTLTKLNIIKFSLICAGVFVSLCFSPVTYAKEKEISSQEVVKLINLSRTQSNLSPLNINPTLSKVAQSKATDMTKNHYFSHTSPQGVTPWHWFESHNYFYKYAGENLAINYNDAQEEHAAWMDSPTHKKNILSSNFNEIGIATATGIINGKRSKITVTVFGTPQENIFAATARTPLASRNSYILGVQSSNKSAPVLATTQSSYLTKNIYSRIVNLVKKQSPNIIWTIALTAMLIVSRDIVLKTINTRTFHHKHSLVNLILFIMIYSIFF